MIHRSRLEITVYQCVSSNEAKCRSWKNWNLLVWSRLESKRLIIWWSRLSLSGSNRQCLLGITRWSYLPDNLDGCSDTCAGFPSDLTVESEDLHWRPFSLKFSERPHGTKIEAWSYQDLIRNLFLDLFSVLHSEGQFCGCFYQPGWLWGHSKSLRYI